MIKIITVNKNNMSKEKLIEEFNCYRSSISRFKDLPDDEILEFLNYGYIKVIEEKDAHVKLLGIAHVVDDDNEIIIDFLPLFDEVDKFNNKLYIKSIIELLENSIKYSLVLENLTKLINMTLNVYIENNDTFLQNIFEELGYKYRTYHDGIVNKLYMVFNKKI